MTGQTQSPDDRKITAWIEANIGGVVERCERHARWRAGWWVDLRKDSKLLALYVRGAREEEYPPWPLEHEAGVFGILERHGIPAPHVYGVCPDPHAIVMEVVPGRHNLATAQDDGERLAVLNHLAEIMARMHAIDPTEAVAVGMKMPQTAEESALSCYEACDAIYLRGKKRPDPRIEFLRRWVRRNVPQHRTRAALIQVDAGQYLFDEGRITGMIDFEYACLGDPMIDLATVVLRAVYEPMGDLRPLFDRYAELTGEAFELDALCYHLVWWALITPMIVAPDLPEPIPSAAYCDYVAWYVAGMLGSLEALADLKGIDLEVALPTRNEQPSRWSPVYGVIAARLADNAGASEFAREQAANLLEFARRIDAGQDFEREYLNEVSAILGTPVTSWDEADRDLEAFVLEAGPAHDERLVRLFYKWCKAQASLLDGLVYMPNFTQKIQPFSKLIGK